MPLLADLKQIILQLIESLTIILPRTSSIIKPQSVKGKQILLIIMISIRQVKTRHHSIIIICKSNIRSFVFILMSEKKNRQSFKSEKKKQYIQKSRSKSKAKSESKQKKDRIVFMRISDEEQGVTIPFSMWCEAFKKVIKQNGGRWCPVFKIWKARRVQMQFIRKELSKMVEPDFETPPYFIEMVGADFDVLQINGKEYRRNQFDISKHPLFPKLYPFQRETLQFCLARHGRILIADQMGVGKSIQSLACSLLYEESLPILIICPSALKYVWKDEVGKWLKAFIQAHQVIIIKKGVLAPNQISNAKVVIVSYELASKLTKEFTGFNIVICDEAHYLKNPDTSRCQQLVPFLSRRKRVFLLTGTPALAKPRELFNLLKILRPDIFRNFDHFGQRYCEKRQNPWSFKWQFDGAKNLAQLHYILKKTVMIRRLKEQVLPQLPPKQRQIIFMETQKSVISEIKQLLGSSLPIDNIRNSEKLMNNFERSEHESESMMRCYLLSAMAKIQSVKEYITAILQNDVKIIIFAHHKVIMDELDSHLKSLKYQYIRLDGDCSAQTRKKKVDNFQHEFDIRAAILSITAMGTGFTLTAASTVIFAELHWTPAMLIQAQDRTHRIGQKNSVNVHYLIGDKTLDPLMLRQLQRKIDTVGKLLDAAKDSLDMEVIEKGEFGKFEVISGQENHQKGSRITDYFPKQVKFQQFAQKMKDLAEDERVSEMNATQVRGRQATSQSQDSMIMEFIHQKRMEAKTQIQTGQ